MAGLNPAGPAPLLPESRPSLSSRQFFRTITWLRWRIFVNTLRGKGAAGELVVKVISYPILAVMILGPSFGAGFGAWYLMSRGMDAYLAIPLWIIFALWQVVGVSTSATGPTFDLASLTRFPIRYRDYLVMRLSFGLMDPPTLAGIGCLTATSIGIGIAAPSLFPFAAAALLVYALCNIFFSRMIYTWMERWLAQRRTREMVTGLILLGSLGIQFASQFIQRFSTTGHHPPPSPWMLVATHWLLIINWVLPPGLTAFAIQHAHEGTLLLGSAAFAALLAYTVAFLYILHVRLHAQYLGENLSEAPAGASKKTIRKARSAALVTPSRSSFALLPANTGALLLKETRLLMRSGPKLYSLVMPVFVVFLFSFRTAGLDQAGIAHGHLNSYLFIYGCAYTQLIFTGFMYNALGSDGAGVQFYYLAPIRFRQVMLAKNLLIGIILIIEVALIFGATVALGIHTETSIIATTLTWTAFAFLLNISIGNVRSLVSPKGYDPAKVRRQNVSALSSFISLGVAIAAAALGQLSLFLCHAFGVSYWVAAGLFLALAIIAFALYLLVLNRVDKIAAEHVEELTRELGKF
jgi:ABC-2 type transport system permease protein